MAFDKTPTTWLENWSADSTVISVPIATFPELSAAEAHPTTGDIRDIVFAIVEKLWSTWNDTASADRPNKWRMTKRASVNTTYNKITSTYTFTIETDIGTQEVRDEFSSTPSHTVSHTPSHTVSHTVSHTASHTVSRTPSHTVSHTVSHTASHTQSHTVSHTPSHTVSHTPSHTVSRTPSNTASHTVSRTPSHTVSHTPSHTVSDTPSSSPT